MKTRITDKRRDLQG